MSGVLSFVADKILCAKYGNLVGSVVAALILVAALGYKVVKDYREKKILSQKMSEIKVSLLALSSKTGASHKSIEKAVESVEKAALVAKATKVTLQKEVRNSAIRRGELCPECGGADIDIKEDRGRRFWSCGCGRLWSPESF